MCVCVCINVCKCFLFPKYPHLKYHEPQSSCPICSAHFSQLKACIGSTALPCSQPFKDVCVCVCVCVFASICVSPPYHGHNLPEWVQLCK